MNKKGLILLVLMMSLFLLGCGQKQENALPLLTIEERVDDQLKNLSLDEKIGQMLIIDYNSTQMDDTLRQILENNKPGGFILFGNNISTYENTLRLVNDIKATNSQIPLFMSIDQEGGLVQRLKKISDIEVSSIPPMYDLGKTGNYQLAYDVGSVVASELRAFGVNMDFAPVIDIWSNDKNTVIGNRAFGKTSEDVIRMSFPFGKALSDNSVIPVYKHFPGHGDTIIDTHYDLPIIEKTKEELMSLELLPFKHAISEGVDIIMIGHLQLSKIDDLPASLSYKVITELLKNELGFKGLVVTDALNMKALTNNYTNEEIYEKAINAGVDILLMPHSTKETIDIIKGKVLNGVIEEEQINESVRKILTLKYSMIKDDILPKSVLGSVEHKNILEKIYE